MDEDDPVTPGGLRIAPASLSWRFSRSSGPGGQHVNTTDSRVELRCDLELAGLPEDVAERVRARLGDPVRVVSSAERSQLRNRQLALERLAQQLDAAAVPPRRRRPTRVPRRAVTARLEDKRRQSVRKAERRARPDD